MFCRPLFEIHPTASSKLLTYRSLNRYRSEKKSALNFVVEKAKPRNGEKTTQFKLFWESILLFRFPSVFSPCSTAYYRGIFCAFHCPSMVKLHSSGIINFNILTLQSLLALISERNNKNYLDLCVNSIWSLINILVNFRNEYDITLYAVSY